jgi:hypothetical protein
LCKYNLSGLPDDHKCPECGFPYEHASLLFSQRRWGWIALCIANAILFLGGVMIFLWRGELNVALAGGAVAFVGIAWRLHKPKRFILVSSRSLRLVAETGAEQRYPMEEIDRATWVRRDGNVEVRRCGGGVLVRIPKSVLWSHRRSKELAATITRYAAQSACERIGDSNQDE